MCVEICKEAERVARLEEFRVLLPSYYGAMMPYRDFMAVHRKEDTEEYSFLGFVFHTKELPNSHLEIPFYTDRALRLEISFRLHTAEKMLSAPPIRYCVPLRCCVPLQI